MSNGRAVSPRAIIAVLGYCGALVSITQTVTLPLLPILPEELGTSVSNVSWVATAAFLTGAVANPVFGRLGDMYGERRMMIIALEILVVGCVISAVSTGLLVLVIGRALQGVGIAVIPLGMSVAKATLPPDKTNQGVALVSATLGIGSGLGLPLAGVLVDGFNWQAVFWVNAALSLVALALAFIVLPESKQPTKQRFDVIGAVWLSVCLVAILLPLSKSSTWGFAQPLPLALYALGFLGLAGWYRYELRPNRPLVDVQLMGQRTLLLLNSAGLLMGFAMFSNMYGSVALLQTPDSVDHGFGASVVMAGMVMLPGALAMMATSPVSAWITDHYSGRVSMITGTLIIGIGYATRPWMLDSMLALGVSVAVVNAGVGIAYGAFASVTMAYVPDDETASANSIGTLTRASGASLSSAAVAAILTSLTITTVGGVELPSLGAFELVFMLSAGAAFVAAAVAWRLPRTSPSDGEEEEEVSVDVAGGSLFARFRARHGVGAPQVANQLDSVRPSTMTRRWWNRQAPSTRT